MQKPTDSVFHLLQTVITLCNVYIPLYGSLWQLCGSELLAALRVGSESVHVSVIPAQKLGSPMKRTLNLEYVKMQRCSGVMASL